MEPGLRLLQTDAQPLERPRAAASAIASVLFHVLLGVLVVAVPWGPAIVPMRDLPAAQRVTPLIAIPRELTQTAPNRAKVSQEVNLSSLLTPPTEVQRPAQPAALNPASRPRQVPIPPAPVQAAQQPVMEAPRVEGRGTDVSELARNVPGLGNPQIAPPPPQIQTEEKPKLAFEKPGGITRSPNTGAAPGRVPLPARASVDEATRAVARAGGGGLVVGDLGEGVGGIGEALRNPNSPTRNASALELMSDPQGVDFKPYLIRILSSVRRNWLAVYPESARLGRQGRVLIQFAIDKDGAVPKLVISGASGTDALDRAAVAGISASNPFPPLPDEFKGQQIRLQFTFLYNVAR
ncbi:MAG: energy transducer TonB [Acidobacteria bacterium]|nr:energy transducer TonB [Acidobacteriota bacterium]